mmetsp:Transcript_60206/g.140720  ORF Transcript_60206/g.140720 Transcript_60206/m.140720 type:complete len:286 (-) Transcript_60206:147-1004(-)
MLLSSGLDRAVLCSTARAAVCFVNVVSEALHELLEAVSVPIRWALFPLAHACLCQRNPVQVLHVCCSKGFERNVKFFLRISGCLQNVHRVVPCVLSGLSAFQTCESLVTRTIFQIRVRFCIKEELRLEIHVIFYAHVQSSLAIEVLSIHIRAILQKKARQPHVAVLGCDVQGQVPVLSIHCCGSICHCSVNAELLHNLLDFLWRLAPTNGRVYLLDLLLIERLHFLCGFCLVFGSPSICNGFSFLAFSRHLVFGFSDGGIEIALPFLAARAQKSTHPLALLRWPC